MHKILKDTLSGLDLEYLLAVFEREQHYFTRSMEKAGLPMADNEFLAFINDIIKNKIGITDPYQIVGDNFYKHVNSYFPHCDAIEETAWLNIVIPLRLEQPRAQQKFIVFDQIWQGKNATWMGNYNFTGDFASNKKIVERPSDSSYFNQGTGNELPEEIWSNLEQKYFTRDYFFSMSGCAYDWTPGNIIIFDSQHIHATGAMQAVSKTGLSIRIAHL
jgi:hypothetical protein